MKPLGGLGVAEFKVQAVQGLQRIRLLIDAEEQQLIDHLRQAALGPTAPLPLAPLAFPCLVWRIADGIGRRKRGHQARKFCGRQARRGQQLSRSILSRRIGQHLASRHYPR